ncbi:MAG: hypothetical protein KME11_02220 [Timaviella obliquedivisa GSE-PSE-MK23-08B]|jgi:hypothetical protein|nr:hypothetical protein [Timaviella obliquedivisa GSE-PSE-MK23-08B]
MTRGLLWLPLLAVFIGLAWAGWNEYQKLEVYRGWAEQFDRAKFDIYSVLGQRGDDLTWGKPTRKGILDLQTFNRQQVESIYLVVDRQPTNLESPPIKARQVAIAFRLLNVEKPTEIPFTDLELAVQWGKFLKQWWRSQERDVPLDTPL